MRFLLPAVAVCLLFGSAAVSLSIASALSWADDAGTPAAPKGPSEPAKAPVGTSGDNDAAAKHTKRTACLKEAKTKKLVGAQRAAFVKDCVGAP